MARPSRSFNSTLLDVFRIIRIWGILSCLFTLKECFAQYYWTIGQLLQHTELQCRDTVSTERPIRGVPVGYTHESSRWDMFCMVQQCITMAKLAGLGLPYPVIWQTSQPTLQYNNRLHLTWSLAVSKDHRLIQLASRERKEHLLKHLLGHLSMMNH